MPCGHRRPLKNGLSADSACVIAVLKLRQRLQNTDRRAVEHSQGAMGDTERAHQRRLQWHQLHPLRMRRTAFVLHR